MTLRERLIEQGIIKPGVIDPPPAGEHFGYRLAWFSKPVMLPEWSAEWRCTLIRRGILKPKGLH